MEKDIQYQCPEVDELPNKTKVRRRRLRELCSPHKATERKKKDAERKQETKKKQEEMVCAVSQNNSYNSPSHPTDLRTLQVKSNLKRLFREKNEWKTYIAPPDSESRNQ